MSKTASKISEKQQAIDKCWVLYNRATDACEDLYQQLADLEDNYEVDVDKAQSAAYEAQSALETALNEGSSILPAYSGDGGRA
jgi:hypothetical protein